MKYTPIKSFKRGFSLVEMLVVIAVIGIIAAIAIPNIGNINSASTTAKDQRNAQTIVSVYQAAAAAGAPFTTATRAGLIGEVIAGVSPTEGPFTGTRFAAPNITTATDLTAHAYKYIKLESDSTLGYDKAGGHANDGSGS